MERVEHRIKLNLMKAGLQGQVIVKKADSDSQKINIYLSSAAGPFNVSDIASAILRAEKPDGKVMFNSCTVCEDRLEYIITTQTIAATGTVTCEITLTSDSGQILVTPRFEIIVADVIYSDSEIESTNEYTALEEAIKKASALKDGTTFTPSVSNEGVLSWSNSDGKDNPAAVNIKGSRGDKGDPGKDGVDGSPGADGITPHIGENGNWYIGSTDTGKPSRGEKGDPGKDGADGGSGTPGVGDVTPIIGENGNWFVGNTDTGKPSRGEKGDPGKDGVDGSPGAAGADGVTPHIGENGNWYIGNTDTGKPSRGVAGARGDTGATGADGKTPVKGTDYWTVADKQEIVNDVIAALPDGTEVSY